MALFLLSLATTVGTQIVGLFGIFFVLGFLLSVVQKQTHRIYHRSIGWKGILWTAWIGTPIHEWGHVVFCKLFYHRIIHISLFEPNKDTGGLGSVDHSYNPKSIYQQVGNFFIGAAPMIFGSLFLVSLFILSIPNAKTLFHVFSTGTVHLATLPNALFVFFLDLAMSVDVMSWHFWLFLYISFAVSSHIAPSKEDRLGMWKGFFWIVALIVIANTVALFLHTNLTAYVAMVNHVFPLLTAVFVYALLLSVCHLIVASIVLFPFKK